jgi:CRISPR-associated protein Csm3
VALKLTKYKSITGTVTLKSGSRVGSSKDDLEIGGMDNPVIRHPLTKLPYIPGSSLKGKLRSLLEYANGKVQMSGRNAGEPCGCAAEDCLVCRVFGPHKMPNHGLGPSRVIVRDLQLTPDSAQELEKLREDGLVYVEVKTENMIDRRTGVATKPRPVERIPAGAKFTLNLSVRIFDIDREYEERIIKCLTQALNMLSQDTLGGSGTRGYGWVEVDYTISEHTVQEC